MKKIFKYSSVLITFVLMLTLFKVPIQAASASVSVSSGQVYVGDSVTFTVSATGAGYVNISGAVNTSIWLENSSQSFTVPASSEGTLSVSISGVLADFTTEQDVPVSGSASVQVISRPQSQPSVPETPSQPSQSETEATNTETTTNQEEQNTTQEQEQEDKNQEEKEKQENSEHNLRLASLTVSKGALNPDFDPDQYTYDVTVDSSVSSIKINAEAQDKNVEVKGTGKKNLKEASSTFEIVTSSSETEETSTYTITVHKRQKGQIVKNKNGDEFEIINEEIPSIEGFEAHTLNIDGNEVNGLYSQSKGIVLIYCYNEKQEANYYIFNEEDDLVESIYIPVTLFSKSYAVVDIPEDEELTTGFKEANIEVDGQTLPGYEFENKDFSNYAIFYLMDENGKSNFYQFERTQNVLQLYSKSASITQKQYLSMLKEKSGNQKIMFGLLSLDVLLLIGLIVLILLYKNVI